MHVGDEHLQDEIEITDIPSAGKKSLRFGREKHVHPAIRNGVFTVLLILLVVVFAFISMPSLPEQLASFIPSPASQDGAASSAHAISITGNSGVTIIKEGGFRVLPKAMPVSCRTSESGGSTNGKSLFWITGFDGSNRRIHLAPLDNLRHALPGWLIPFHIDYPLPLTLNISSVTEGLAPSFLVPDSEALSPTLGLPFSGGVPGSTTVHVVLPGAGCYLLRASWAYGSGEVAFAAGA